MSPATHVRHEFVEFIPEVLDEGVLYVSMQHATVVHRCCCGCGREVVTPLSPADWRLTFDGEAISLSPSIGNWSYPCRSHYWIEGSRVRWSYRMSEEAIQAGRKANRLARSRYDSDVAAPLDEVSLPPPGEPKRGRWSKLNSWWRRTRRGPD